MLVSCKYCNGLHKRGTLCNKRTRTKKKEPNHITRFRSSRIWQKKREEIVNRDKHLCQWCLLENRYNFHKLEVHHITPIAKNWEQRLNNLNLITLCNNCHKMAESGIIEKRELLRIAEKNNDNLNI